MRPPISSCLSVALFEHQLAAAAMIELRSREADSARSESSSRPAAARGWVFMKLSDDLHRVGPILY